MRLKPKLLNAILLGLTMFLSMQTAFAACKQSFAAQQKKVATISKKRVVKSKKRTYRKASARKYSHRELNAIMRILERKFLSEDKTPALRNVVGFGMGSNSIDVALRWNTKEKQLEFRRQIYNSPAIRFEGKLDPIIDNREGVSTYQGISLKAEKPSYPLSTTEIRFTITNHSGEEFVYGEAYSISPRSGWQLVCCAHRLLVHGHRSCFKRWSKRHHHGPSFSRYSAKQARRLSLLLRR